MCGWSLSATCARPRTRAGAHGFCVQDRRCVAWWQGNTFLLPLRARSSTSGQPAPLPAVSDLCCTDACLRRQLPSAMMCGTCASFQQRQPACTASDIGVRMSAEGARALREGYEPCVGVQQLSHRGPSVRSTPLHRSWRIHPGRRLPHIPGRLHHRLLPLPWRGACPAAGALPPARLIFFSRTPRVERRLRMMLPLMIPPPSIWRTDRRDMRRFRLPELLATISLAHSWLLMRCRHIRFFAKP